MDDCGFAIEDVASKIVASTSRAMSLIHEVFCTYGLQVNYRPGKTEAVMSICGPGSRLARRDLLIKCSAKISVPLACGLQQLTAARAYKHLGSIFSADLSMALEVQHRTTCLTQTIGSLQQTVLSSSAVNLTTKCTLIGALCWSRLLYLCATWHSLRPGPRRTMNGAYMRVLRRAAGVTYDNGDASMSDMQVLVAVAAPSLPEILRLSRASYVPRLVKHAPRHLLVLLDVEQTWLNALRLDLQWLQTETGFFSALPCPLDDCTPWVDFAADHPNAWRRAISTARNCLVARRARTAERPVSSPRAHAEASPAYFCCYECGASFGMRRALLVHAQRCFAYAAPVWSCIHSTCCVACLLECHTVARIREHLARGSPACARRIKQNVAPPAPSVRQDMLRAASQQQASRSPLSAWPAPSLPAIRAAGPLPRWALA